MRCNLRSITFLVLVFCLSAIPTYSEVLGWNCTSYSPGNAHVMEGSPEAFSIRITAPQSSLMMVNYVHSKGVTWFGNPGAYKGYPDGETPGLWRGDLYLYTTKPYKDATKLEVPANGNIYLHTSGNPFYGDLYHQGGSSPWANHYVGHGTLELQKMKFIGCAVTASAGALTRLGIPTEPGQLNGALRSIPGAFLGKVNLVFPKIVEYAKSRGRSIVYKRGLDIREALTRIGIAVISLVKNGRHKVEPYAVLDEDGYVISDPSDKTNVSSGYYGVSDDDTRCFYNGGCNAKAEDFGPIIASLGVESVVDGSVPDEAAWGNSCISAFAEDATLSLQLIRQGNVLATSEKEEVENQENGEVYTCGTTLEYTQLPQGNYVIKIVGLPGQNYNVDVLEYDITVKGTTKQFTGTIPGSGSVEVSIAHESPVMYLMPVSLDAMPSGLKVVFELGYITANVPGGFILQSEKVPAIKVIWGTPVTINTKIERLCGVIGVDANGKKTFVATKVVENGLVWLTETPKPSFVVLEHLSNTFSTYVKTIGTVTNLTANGFTLDNSVQVKLDSSCAWTPTVGAKQAFIGVYYEGVFYVSKVGNIPSY